MAVDRSRMVEIPFVDCPLHVAVHIEGSDAEDHYYRTMAKILRVFPQFDADSYWRLTVAEHALLLEGVG